MAKMNENFLNLKKSYLFIEIGKRVREYIAAHPDNKIIRMGIGDVTIPLVPVVVEAMKKASAEMGVKETFRGYEDSGLGYDFLREAIAGYYKKYGVDVAPEEVLISDGAKSDCGNIGDILSADNTVLITDPAYPVYVDANVMGGRNILFANSDESNGFAAMPDKSVKADIIYLCSPNNPTGSAYTAAQLKEWVDYALANDAVIIYDSAYEAFIHDPDIPHSIFAIEGARKCAIESARSRRQQDLPACAADIPLSRRSSCSRIPRAASTASATSGYAAREVSSTALRTPFSVQPRLYSPTRGRSRLTRSSRNIWQTQR